MEARHGKKIKIGQNGWVDDAHHLTTGEAWLSVGGSGIAYTTDYGFHWKKINIPEAKQRFASIFFNANKEGIIGSLWNMIAYTPDNGQNWQMLHTPLDQKKYDNKYSPSRPEFTNVGILGDYLFAKQEDLVFYTRKDSVNWICMKDYQNFSIDPEGSLIYFKSKEYISVYSREFQLVQTFSYNDHMFGMASVKDKLFVMGSKEITILEKGKVKTSVLYSSGNNKETIPTVIGYTTSGQVGLSGKGIYVQSFPETNWKILGQLDKELELEKVNVRNNLLVYDSGNDSLVFYHLNGNRKESKAKSDILKTFIENGISQISFERGSQGCFHRYSTKLVYSRIGDIYSNPFEESSKVSSITFDSYPQEISKSTIDHFLNLLPYIFDKKNQPCIQDLAFTDEELAQCKKDIVSFQRSPKPERMFDESRGFSFHRNNLDFKRLISLVDSVKFISQARLNDSFADKGDFWSTTTNWLKIELVGYGGNRLVIQTHFYHEHPFGFPWTININDYAVNTNNIEIYHFIQQVYPNLLNSKKRVMVLHSLVKTLY